MKPTVIDLFCGIGGFSKGFEKAGFKILLGVDNWDVALETFAKNHKGTQVANADIRGLDENFFRQYRNKVDVIIAGPPCQGFSMSGKRNPHDKRNTLFEEVIRVVSIVRPSIVVMENVVGLLSMKTPDGSAVRNLIIRKFREIGYATECRILNAADFGVPQARRRVIFISSKIGGIGFPEVTHSEKPYATLAGNKTKKWVTVGNALGNIPDVGSAEYLPAKTEFQRVVSNGAFEIFNHEPMNHAPEIIKRMSFVPQGGNWRDVPKEHYNVGGEHSNNYRRLDQNRPSITIKHAVKSMIIHPDHDRGLTVREVARLQSFYDSFVIYGNKSEQHQQLANAVPPFLGYEIAQHLKKTIPEKNDATLARSARPRKKTNPMTFTFIDLFSGIGGFRIALEKLGGRCAFSSDIDKWANRTYFQNFGEWPKGDITKIPSEEIPDHDILCAGFPCQAFSIAGHRKGFDDTRGTLFFEVARILRDKKPEAFILENVRGITNHDNGRTIGVIRTSLHELGYNTFESVLNLKDYGLPQNRERWLCAGFRKDLNIGSFSFPPPIPLDKTVADILEKNVVGHEPTATAWKHIQNHYNKFLENKNSQGRNSGKVPRQSRLVVSADGLSPCLTTGKPPLVFCPNGNKNREYTIVTQVRPSKCTMNADGVSPCLTAKMGTGGNNIPVVVELKRKFTTRECLRLMGFPEDFEMNDSSHQSYKQIGNSVPVPIVEKIAERIIKVIDSNEKKPANRKKSVLA